MPGMPDNQLVTIEFRFVTNEDAQAMGERVREAVRLIVSPAALEDFRIRTMPLSKPPKGRPEAV
jgi:hypothetical protein